VELASWLFGQQVSLTSVLITIAVSQQGD